MGWTIHHDQAAFESADYRFQLQLGSPPSGLLKLSYGGTQLPVRPFQLSWLSKTTEYRYDEAYCRGNDLVVTYRLAGRQRVYPQLVWSAANERGISLTISMQTPELESDPRIESRTDFTAAGDCGRLAGDELYGATPSTFLFRPADHDLSYAEMIFPNDLGGSVDLSNKNRLCYQILSERLEKGVIRKARLRAIVLPRREDERLAAAAFAAFLADSPPLTT